jgi:hypothetical protein
VRTDKGLCLSRSDELRGAFRLIHQAYVQRGLALPNSLEMRVTPYHGLISTEVVIGRYHEDVICTATIIHDGDMGLPMECVYQRDVEKFRERNLKICEISCLADRRKHMARSFPALSRLMSLIAQSSFRRGTNEVLIAVHPRHARFYERYLGFTQFADERTYPSVRNHPAVALHLDLNNLAENNPEAYQRLFGEPFGQLTIERPRISPDVWNEVRTLIQATGHSAAAQTA